MTIDGRALADSIYVRIRPQISERRPTLSLIRVGSDAVADNFVRVKQKAAEKLGVHFSEVKVEEIEAEIIKAILNVASGSDGIVVQLPLPKSVNADKILEKIPPEKDIDALRPDALERFKKGEGFTPPVAGAIDEIFKVRNVSLEGKNIVVVGRGKLVGLPVVVWLEREGVTPVVLDEFSKDNEGELQKADIIISGAGSPHFIKPEMIKDGVILVDAGTSEQGGAIVGDFDPTCEAKARLFTPVPGGVGPVTVAKLFENLVEAATQ